MASTRNKKAGHNFVGDTRSTSSSCGINKQHNVAISPALFHLNYESPIVSLIPKKRFASLVGRHQEEGTTYQNVNKRTRRSYATYSSNSAPSCTTLELRTSEKTPINVNLDVTTTALHQDPASIQALKSPVTQRPMATSADLKVLNPIHCFVRENVEIFIATAQDVSAPSPGRRTPISLHQVGIRCLNCKHLPFKQRAKRAISYPPSIASLYHAVSNMKCDHFGACKGLSPTQRQQFAYLKSASSRKGGGKYSKMTANRTGRFYEESAISSLGLVDSNEGLRAKNNCFEYHGNGIDSSPRMSVILDVDIVDTSGKGHSTSSSVKNTNSHGGKRKQESYCEV